MILYSRDLPFAESLCSELSDAYAVRVISDWPELIRVLSSLKYGLALVDQHYPVTEIMALSPATKVLVVAEDVNDKSRYLDAFLNGVRGFYIRATQHGLLQKAVAQVLCGNFWIERWAVAQLLANTVASSADRPHQVDEPPTGGSGTGFAVFNELSPREHEVATLVSKGLANKLIARKLDITERTVKAHLTTIFGKLGINDRLQLALLVTVPHSPTSPDCHYSGVAGRRFR